MKSIFDAVSLDCSKLVTQHYSTSFSLATKMLATSIRGDIYNIYGFVRFADEIVDSFHEYDKLYLLNKFEKDLNDALEQKISLNPILNSFQHTFHKYDIPLHLITSFLKSMRMDLEKRIRLTDSQYQEYIYGSADAVGLMCLRVFVKGNKAEYEKLKPSAMALGSAFQKVNFLRDLKTDFEVLNRTYFPNTDLHNMTEDAKNKIVNEIKADFKLGYSGIIRLPKEAKFGVFTAYRYYFKLLKKLEDTPSSKIMSSRIRVSNLRKFRLLAKSYIDYKFKLV
ncbi:phytoene/squalene synthase family protein [Arenibacter sp. ARW7G5Y1]|uniref:phytoene/squalene synthase family protein n=1 Tax=Arenibacter sp. ARW7G5Y1 TaxID=2135619 RepID=UPI000D76AE9A|nr:phytoene/squalene synthase family protein [Arenibacter sp. ARW7G5Y1]PXX23253.1 phytoene/squalene synthetase [Arenibacter sp. ARW7G5Y1]